MKKNERIQIQATVLKVSDTAKPIMIEPMVIALDSIRPDNPEEDWKFKVAMVNIGEENVKAHLVSGPTELCEIKVSSKDVKPGKEQYIELAFDDRILEEMFAKSLTIELDDSAATRYTIPILKSRRWGPTRRASR